jgi:hypothetical protein
MASRASKRLGWRPFGIVKTSGVPVLQAGTPLVLTIPNGRQPSLLLALEAIFITRPSHRPGTVDFPWLEGFMQYNRWLGLVINMASRASKRLGK